MNENLMISVSGVRGIVGESLTPLEIVKFATAFGNFCKKGKVVMGSDTRPSKEMVKNAVVSGLLATGCKIIDIGIAPTPTIAMATRNLKAKGGIAITASHNPIEWNALKFMDSQGMFLDSKKSLAQMVEKNCIKYENWKNLGEITTDQKQIEAHIEKILKLKYVNLSKIKEKKPKVVVDCVNGAGSIASVLLLEALGCKVIKLYCDIDGKFPRPPEPVPESLKDLCQKVISSSADLGFALDPDADRLSLVSEKGIALGEEYTLALATKFILSKKKGAVVVNQSTSRMIDDIAKNFKVTVHRTKVGEAHVAERLKKVKGVIGGEGNGGVIFPSLHYNRDALVGMALILSYLCESEKTLSQLAKEIPQYHIVKKFGRISQSFSGNLSKIRKIYKSEKQSEIDGLKIDTSDFWLHIRKSNTEPQVRVIAEAKSKKEAERLAKKTLRMISKN